MTLSVLCLFASPVTADVRLVMVEQAGCAWCARWNAEIGPVYPKTSEGRAAPLRRIDLHQAIPDDLVLTSPPRLTPTFIVVRDGIERARMEGYAGEEFFWVVLDRMLETAALDTQ